MTITIHNDKKMYFIFTTAEKYSNNSLRTCKRKVSTAGWKFVSQSEAYRSVSVCKGRDTLSLSSIKNITYYYYYASMEFCCVR